MKTALFHDYFSAIGGGEKTVVAMANALSADIITTDPLCLSCIGWSGQVKTIGKLINLPLLKQSSASLGFMRCDLSDEYDYFVYSGNWAHIAAKNHENNVWYCHSPPRILYDQFPRYYQMMHPMLKGVFAAWADLHRKLDKSSVQHLDTIVTNSKNVQSRINQYYNRNSEVIYPPVDCKEFSCREYGDFWLSVNRLYSEKRIELQIDAFKMLPDESLYIVGGYARNDYASLYARHLIRNKPSNVTFLGEIQDEKLLKLYAHCKGVICTALDEDFGIVPLEAMASGKPVVAVNEGGYLETVQHGITGLLTRSSVSELTQAIEEISERPEEFYNACVNRAQDFDLRIFTKKIRTAVHGD